MDGIMWECRLRESNTVRGLKLQVLDSVIDWQDSWVRKNRRICNRNANSLYEGSEYWKKPESNQVQS